MRHALLVSVMLLWASPSHANTLATNEPAKPALTAEASAKPVPEGASQSQEEVATEVVHHDSLAAYLGLTSKDAEFGSPRNFREDHLNEVKFDGE